MSPSSPSCARSPSCLCWRRGQRECKKHGGPGAEAHGARPSASLIKSGSAGCRRSETGRVHTGEREARVIVPRRRPVYCSFQGHKMRWRPRVGAGAEGGEDSAWQPASSTSKQWASFCMHLTASGDRNERPPGL